MNFVPPRTPRRAARTQCRNCGAPAQECGAPCSYCSVVVEAPAVAKQPVVVRGAGKLGLG